MAKFIFNVGVSDIREASNIELQVPDDMTIWEYKTICVRMASAMGYSQKSIQSAFGPLESKKSNSEEYMRFLSLINEYTGSLI